MKITKICFDNEHIIGTTEEGKELKQSLLWYPELMKAEEDVRNEYRFGEEGIFWDQIDVQISFESFLYPDAEPTRLQRFFLTHQEINVTGFAKKFGLNPSLLRSYINGFKTPSSAREQEILDLIHKLGAEYSAY
jgi:Protein of unknown function (DUF3532).